MSVNINYKCLHYMLICCNCCHMFSHAQDMVAFSCCVFDGGKQEREDMIAARERGWKGKFTKPGRVIRPGAIRINGKCPLTPLEVIISWSYFSL